MPLPSSRYKTDQTRVQFWEKLQPQLAALPGVISVAAADGVPLSGSYSADTIEVEGRTAARDWTDTASRISATTTDYFRTLGIPLRSGRSFDAGDTAAAEPVAIVNESFGRRLLPGENPLGKHVRLEKWRRIVGVIGDARYQGPSQEVEPELYIPFTQSPWLEFVAVRTAIPEEGVLSGIRNLVRKMDPALAISQVQTMRQSIAEATALPRQMMALVTGFALLTLGMSTPGLDGVMVYTVSRRKREIRLRIVARRP